MTQVSFCSYVSEKRRSLCVRRGEQSQPASASSQTVIQALLGTFFSSRRPGARRLLTRVSRTFRRLLDEVAVRLQTKVKIVGTSLPTLAHGESRYCSQLNCYVALMCCLEVSINNECVPVMEELRFTKLLRFSFN